MSWFPTVYKWTHLVFEHWSDMNANSFCAPSCSSSFHLWGHFNPPGHCLDAHWSLQTCPPSAFHGFSFAINASLYFSFCVVLLYSGGGSSSQPSQWPSDSLWILQSQSDSADPCHDTYGPASLFHWSQTPDFAKSKNRFLQNPDPPIFSLLITVSSLFFFHTAVQPWLPWAKKNNPDDSTQRAAIGFFFGLFFFFSCSSALLLVVFPLLCSCSSFTFSSCSSSFPAPFFSP